MRKLIFCLLVIISYPILAQYPSVKNSDKKANFYEIKKEFNNIWKNKEIKRKKGWKQFKRWEYFVEPRVYPHGDLSKISLSPNLLDNTRYPSLLKSSVPSWKSLGPYEVPKKDGNESINSGNGRINCIAFHPTDVNTMWVGSPAGGIWKTTDKGNTWVPTLDFLGSIGVSSIAVDPKNPSILYAGTGDRDNFDTYGVGVLKSTDGGNTWNQLSNFHNYEQKYRLIISKILINPIDTKIIYASSNGMLIVSKDSGNSWNSVSGIGNHYFIDMEFNPKDPNIIYVSTMSTNDAKIFKSTNGGDTFQEIGTSLNFSGKVNRIELATTTAPKGENIVMALCSQKIEGDANNDGLYALYKSTDAGSNWSKVFSRDDKNILGYELNGSDKGGQGFYDLAMSISPSDANIVFVGGVNIWKSTDGGSSWKINTHWTSNTSMPHVHADHHYLAYNPLSNELFSCNDGGLYSTNNGGTSWTDKSRGLVIQQGYKISISPNSDLMLIGCQDNGTMRVSNNIWKEVLGGDGMDCAINPQDNNNYIASVYYGDFWRTNDGGRTYSSIKPKDANNGAWVTPLVMDQKSPNIIYAGYDNIFQSTDQGTTWKQLTKDISNGKSFRTMHISKANSNIIYAATLGKIWKTTDQGNTWTDITNNLFTSTKSASNNSSIIYPRFSEDISAISDIESSKYDPKKIFISLSGFAEGGETLKKVLYSIDGGGTWTNYSEGLPNIPTNSIILDDESNQTLYLGTDLGVFYRDKNMNQWERYGKGLPNVVVSDLEIAALSNRLVISTYGRGAWEIELDPSSKKLYAQFEVSHKQICKQGQLTFNSLASPDTDSIKWYFPKDAIPKISKEKQPTVKFNENGLKTISLVAYKNGEKDSITKVNLVDVKDNLTIDVLPNKSISIFRGLSKELTTSGADSYTWSPLTSVVKKSKDTVIISPLVNTIYTVTGTIGQCKGNTTVNASVFFNNNMCDAQLIDYGQSGPYSNKGTDTEVNEPHPNYGEGGCKKDLYWCDDKEGSVLENSVWFYFKAKETISSIAVPGFDNQIAVYEANSCSDLTSGKFTLIAAYDDYDDKDGSAAVDLKNLKVGNNYFVQVDGENGSEGQFSVILKGESLGIKKDNYTNKEVKIYPNPNNGEFSIEFEDQNSGTITIQLYDQKGSLIINKKTKYINKLHERIDIRDYSYGIYFLRIILPKRIVTQKIIYQ